MDLIAHNFVCFPCDSLAFRELGALVAQIDKVHFPISVGERNSNQLTYDFDSCLRSRLVACGVTDATFKLPIEIKQKHDFAFAFDGKEIVVEVEKANWEKILRDILKFHMYFEHGADFAILFLPKLYPHSNGESGNFKKARQLYAQCRRFGFGQIDKFERILLVGYDQSTVEGNPFTSSIRNRLKAEKKNTIATAMH